MRIAVVGGGMAGLFAARALRSRGAEVVLFEAAPKLGGKVGTVRDGGFVAEEGPNAVSGGPIIREAVEREGRTGEIVEAPKGAAR
jgi:protoporphyrinogen oxidase